MADPVKGKLQVLDSQGHPVFTIDPDSGFEQIVYTTTTGQRLMDMSNGTAGTVGVGQPGSAFGPSLSSTPGRFFMAWRGVLADENPWFTQGAPDAPTGGAPPVVEWSTQANVNGFATSHRPSITVFNGAPFLAWKGVRDDHRIFTTTFR